MLQARGHRSSWPGTCSGDVLVTTPVVRATTRCHFDLEWTALREITTGLLAARTEDRYARMLQGIRKLIPCDSVVLMQRDGDALVPIATAGLVPETASQRFVIAEHPRLAQFMRTSGPVRISDHDLPDPFDGLSDDDHPFGRVHACLGCAFEIDGEVVGLLALDANDPHAFDRVADDEVSAFAALAGLAMRGDVLAQRLEREALRAGQVTRELVHETRSPARADLVGQSSAITVVRDDIALAGRSDLAVLITGETGVGKEVVARAICAASPRHDRPLIYVNCAALPDAIAESELFGHVRGAFTGASDHRAGKFEIADGGTLFLDEIGELPLTIQPKLLRALQSGEIQRVGSDKLLRVDARIIAATNRDLCAEVSAGRFRADLYHRLSVYPIHVPPLRDRRDDIALLAGFFLTEVRLRLGLGRIRLTAAARTALEIADWPGNVRELEHTLFRAALRASAGRRHELVVIDAPHLGLDAPAITPIASPTPAATTSLSSAADHVKRDHILAAVQAAHGNWSRAARELGMDRGNLHRLARRLGLISRTGCVTTDTT
jgi:anaerobic nitric oxide reductase transcription regulator